MAEKRRTIGTAVATETPPEESPDARSDRDLEVSIT
jgi:hypothetical protein